MCDVHTEDVAHVIAALLDFTPEQKREVFAKEAAKHVSWGNALRIL